MEYSEFMSVKQLFRVAALFVALFGCKGNAQSQCPADTRTGDLATQFRIGGAAIRMPVGAFLLIRKGGQIGAVRLVNIDSAERTDYGTSAYESYFSANSSGPLAGQTAVRHSGQLDIRPLKGPGRDLWIYKTGAYRALVGNWVFDFTTPDTIWMLPEHHNSDHGYEFAPTSACDLSQIDANDKGLRWFHYDPNASVVLRLADLAK
jgi:hypothetical protein